MDQFRIPGHLYGQSQKYFRLSKISTTSPVWKVSDKSAINALQHMNFVLFICSWWQNWIWNHYLYDEITLFFVLFGIFWSLIIWAVMCLQIFVESNFRQKPPKVYFEGIFKDSKWPDSGSKWAKRRVILWLSNAFCFKQ